MTKQDAFMRISVIIFIVFIFLTLADIGGFFLHRDAEISSLRRVPPTKKYTERSIGQVTDWGKLAELEQSATYQLMLLYGGIEIVLCFIAFCTYSVVLIIYLTTRAK